ncbi:YvrJ family protein [bacterium]|nr:YvrJ family protein [bacterium]
MEELFKLVANYGFPVVISGYLLIRMETKMETLAESIRALTNAITNRFSAEGVS